MFPSFWFEPSMPATAPAPPTMMLGSETELGILDGWTLEKAERIQREVLRDQPFLLSSKSGAFLENGSRVYVDQDRQNEYSTPEVFTPSDLVVRELAGRTLMSEAAARVGCALLCSNVDPVTGSTWGTHENYQCKRKRQSFMMDEFYPHLVSRIIYAGAGGLDLDFSGVRMHLSPRAGLTRRSRSCQGYPCKTLVFDKPEAYCEGFRLHILCGESLLCHTASYLKYATTALIAYGLDHSRFLGPGPLACSPTRALRMLNRDLSLSVKLPFRNGLRLTALEIQQFYLENIDEKINRYPDWAPLAVKRWRQMLNDLWLGDARCATQVDWLVYRNLLGKLASEYGYDDATLRAVNRALAAGQPIDDPSRLGDFKAAAQALYVKLHVIGKESLFQKLEAESALAGDTHRLTEITDEAIRTAMKEPPPGRASHRAVLIRKYRNLPEYEIRWDLLFDLKLRRRLEIPQALHWDGKEAWKDEPRSMDETCRTAARHFRNGEYVSVVKLLDPAFSSSDPFLRERAYTDLCLSYARLGIKKQADKLLEGNQNRYFGSPFEANIFNLFCAVNYGLRPSLGILEPLLEQCESLADQERTIERPFAAGFDTFFLHQSRALVLLARGDATGAESLCRSLLSVPQNLSRTCMTARTRCYLARALYAQRRFEESHEALLPASACHAEERLLWDMADQSLPLEALLTDDPEKARTLLDRAEALHRSQRNPLGIAKILCQKTRRFRDVSYLKEIQHLCTRNSALRDCPVAMQILRDWTSWFNAATASDAWGL